MRNRVTLRSPSLWPTVGLIAGGVLVFSVGFLSLHSLIRSYVGPPKLPPARPIATALAGSTAGLAPSSAVIPGANAAAPAARAPAAAPAATAPAAAPARPDAPKGAWAMSTPPAWLALVDPAAGLLAPAPFATAPQGQELGQRSEDVPLPRPRPRR